VQQKVDRCLILWSSKGETVRSELTSSLGNRLARQTPSGARPNRGRCSESNWNEHWSGVSRVGCLNPLVTMGLDEWWSYDPSGSDDRIRLTATKGNCTVIGSFFPNVSLCRLSCSLAEVCPCPYGPMMCLLTISL
jgi:hypothetical protein